MARGSGAMAVATEVAEDRGSGAMSLVRTARLDVLQQV